MKERIIFFCMFTALCLTGCQTADLPQEESPEQSLLSMYTALESGRFEDALVNMNGSCALAFSNYLSLEYVDPDLAQRRLKRIEIGKAILVEDIAVIPVTQHNHSYYAVMKKMDSRWVLTLGDIAATIKILSYACEHSNAPLIDACLKYGEDYGQGKRTFESYYGPWEKANFPKAPFSVVPPSLLPKDYPLLQILDANQAVWEVWFSWKNEIEKPQCIKVKSVHKVTVDEASKRR